MKRRGLVRASIASLLVALGLLTVTIAGSVAADAPSPSPSKAATEEASEPAPKLYVKPATVALPEGPATVLSGPIAVVSFQAIVNPGMGSYVGTALDRAAREHAQAVLIELDTPGGLVSTTQTIVQAILASKVPVIVFVSPSGAHAASAGTMITMSGHIAAMAKATRIGAAHPVTGSGKDPEAEGGKHMGEKVENDLASFAKSIAQTRNRNVEWAVDAVRRSDSITDDEALRIGVVDLVVADRAELLEKLDGWELMVDRVKVRLATKGAAVVEYTPSLREKAVSFLANPGVAMILGLLGLIGIMVEIYHPGMIAPGVMGVLCMICSLIAVEQLPIDVGGGLLVLAGIGLLIVEIYTPTYGTLGILGGISLTVGLLLFVDPAHPDFAVDGSIRLGLVDVVPIVALFGGLIAYLSWVVMGNRRRVPVTGQESLVGSHGFVLKPVGPDGGMVFVQGEYWKARATALIGEKAEIEVVSVNGLVLEVRAREKSGRSGA